MEDEIIDPILGTTPEKSNKPQVQDLSEYRPKNSRMTPHTQVMGSDLDIGTDLFGKSNLERVNEEFGPTNVFTQDFARLRAAEQPWTHQAAGFIVQAAAEIVGGSIEGIGYLGEIGNAFDLVNSTEQEFGNALTQFGASIKEGAQEAAPIYRLNPEEGWNPGDSGWWFSNGVSIASSLSLLIPSTGVMKGLGLLGKGLSSMGKYGKVTAELLGGASKAAKVGRGVLTQSVVSRHMENMMEASGTWESTYQRQLAAGVTDEEARKNAALAASENYKYGWAMLGQDILEYSLLRGFKTQGRLGSVNKIEDGFYKSIGGTKVGQFLGNHRGVGNLATTFVSEGLEEAFQFIIAENAGYKADLKAGLVDETTFGERMGDYLQDGELWTSAFFGALGGAAMYGVGKINNKKADELQDAMQKSFLVTRGATIAEMVENATKADAAGDFNSSLNTRITAGLDLTVSALDHGRYDDHLADLQEMAQMTDEQLVAYNTENPDTQITPLFRDKVIPELIKQAEEVKGLYTKAYGKYEDDTLDAIIRRQYYINNSTKKAEAQGKELNTLLVESPFKMENTSARTTALELQALEAKKEFLNTYYSNANNDQTREATKERLAEIETSIAEKSVEMSSLELSKADRSSLDALLSDTNIKATNENKAASEEAAFIGSQSLKQLTSEKFQSNASLRKYSNKINSTKTQEDLAEVETEINNANIKDKSDLLKQVKSRKQYLEVKANDAAKESAEAEAVGENAASEFDINLLQPDTGEVSTAGTAKKVEALKEEKKQAIKEAKKDIFQDFLDREVIYQGKKGVLKLEGNILIIETDNHIYELTGVTVEDKLGDYGVEPILTSLDKYEITEISEDTVTVNGVSYIINTNKLGNVESLSPTNNPKQKLKNKKLLIAVEIERNRLEVLKDSESITEDTYNKEIDDNAILKMIDSQMSVNFTEEIDVLLEKLYNKEPLTEYEKLVLDLWVTDAIIRITKLYVKNPNKTIANTLDSLEIINQLLYGTDNKETQSVQDTAQSNTEQQPKTKVKEKPVKHVTVLKTSKQERVDAVEKEFDNKIKELMDSLESGDSFSTEEPIVTTTPTKQPEPVPVVTEEQTSPIEQPSTKVETNTSGQPVEVPLTVTESIGAVNVHVTTKSKNLESLKSFLPGWHSFVTSGTKIEGTKVKLRPSKVEDNTDPVAKQALEYFDRLQKGETLKPEESVYLIDNYPISVIVLDKDGTELHLDGKPVRTFVYKITSDNKTKAIARNIRGNLIKALANNGEIITTLSGGMNTTVLFDNSKFHGPTVENSIELLIPFVPNGLEKDIVTVDKELHYKNSDGVLDPDLTGNDKYDKKYGAGNILMKVVNPSGMVIPIKLNRAHIGEAEAEFLSNLIITIVSRQELTSFTTSVRLKDMPDVEKVLNKIFPEYKEVIGETPMIADVIDLFVHFDQNDVDLKYMKEHDMKLGFFKDKGVQFIYAPVYQYQDGEKTDKLDRTKTKYIYNKNYKDPAVKEALKQHLMQNVRRNIDIKFFAKSAGYRNRLIQDKVLNTDVMPNVFQEPTFNIRVTVPNIPDKPTDKVKPKSVKKVIMETSRIESEENKEAMKNEDAVAINGESQAVITAKANAALLNEKLKSLKKKCD